MTKKQSNPFLVEVYEMVEALYENYDPRNGDDLHAHEAFEKLLDDKCKWADGRAEHEKLYGTDMGAVVNDRIEKAERNVQHLRANREEDIAKTAAWTTITAWRATYPLPEGTKVDSEILFNKNDAFGWAIMDDLKEEIQALLPALAQLGAEADSAYDDLSDDCAPDLSDAPPVPVTPPTATTEDEIAAWDAPDEVVAPPEPEVDLDDDDDLSFLESFPSAAKLTK